MPKHSKELLIGITHLNKFNLNTHTPYQPLTDLLITPEKHKKDTHITQLIAEINHKYALTDSEKQAYQKAPLEYMGEGSIIGIHNSRGETYRIIRAEHYREYSLLCKNLERVGLAMYLIHDDYLDAIFC